MSEFSDEVHEGVTLLATATRARHRPSHNHYIPTSVLTEPIYAEQVAVLTGLNCAYDRPGSRYVYRRGQFSDKELVCNKWRRL